MKTLFLLTTALTVSVDSLVCGLSLSLNSKRKFPIACLIASIVLVMCEITNYLGYALNSFFTEDVASFGGVILIAIGLFNLLSSKSKGSSLGNVIFAGFAVGLDGAFANLSLSLMGFNDFYVPIVIAFMHFITVLVGILLANTKALKAVSKFDFVAPLILVFLGFYKILGIFV